jgi:large-conductance mechanosensitive channel
VSAQRTAGAADRAGQSDALENLARIGLIALGVVHVLIGWLAFQMAWFGGGGESADQSGALSTLADSPVGGPLLWVLGIGLFALALWQAAEVLRWRHGLSASGKQRRTAIGRIVKSVAKAILYVALGVLALQTANGTEKSSEESTGQTAQGVMGLPAGRFLVGAIGLIIVGVGVYHVYKGWTKKFLEGIDVSQASPSARRWIERSGQVGYPAKGVALVVVGALFVWAAITFDAKKAAGLDTALRTVLDAPFGKFLLTLIALGLVAFGVFCFARARYPERT